MNQIKNLGKDYINDVYFEICRNTEYFDKITRNFPDDHTVATPVNYFGTYIKLIENFNNDFGGKKILEIGSGPGIFMNFLHGKGSEVYAVDKKTYGNLPENNGINFLSADILGLGGAQINVSDMFPNAGFDKFDAIITRYFLEGNLGLSCVGLRESDVGNILKKTRKLSDLQIHESGGRGISLLHSLDLGSLGYDSEYELLDIVTSPEIHVLRPKKN